MGFSYNLTYAGIPLLADQAKVVRLAFNKGEPSASPPTLIKHQPWSELISELDKLIDSGYLQDYGLSTDYPGRNLGAIARPTPPNIHPLPYNPKINQFYYPNGASRWSVFRGLATSSMVKAITGQLTANTNPGVLVPNWQNAPFIMQAAAVSPNNPQGAPDNYTITTPMYMLPPRPLAEHGAGFDGLYLITLVDERFYWQYAPTSIKPTQFITWHDLLAQLALHLNITLNFNIVPQVYGQPEPDSQLWTNVENSAVLLDAIAANTGTVVVRNLDGTYVLRSWSDVGTVVNANLLGMAGNLAPGILLSGFITPGSPIYPTSPYPARTAGGEIFNSGTGTNLPVGDLTSVQNAVIPGNGVDVAFPMYVRDDDPVPHFANTRYPNQRPSCWYEESYGDMFVINVPLSSGAGVSGGGWDPNQINAGTVPSSGFDFPLGSPVSGLVGIPGATHVLRTTAKALYSGEVFF